MSQGPHIRRVGEDLIADPSPSLSWTIFSVMTYTVVALAMYAYASYGLRKEARPLESRSSSLEIKLHDTRRATKELSKIVASLSDPAADEYALITELGRVPEGSRKMLLPQKVLKNQNFASAAGCESAHGITPYPNS